MPGCDADKFRNNLVRPNDDNYRQLSVIRTCPDPMNFSCRLSVSGIGNALCFCSISLLLQLESIPSVVPRRSSQVHLITLSPLLKTSADPKLYIDFRSLSTLRTRMRTTSVCANVYCSKQLKNVVPANSSRVQ